MGSLRSRDALHVRKRQHDTAVQTASEENWIFHIFDCNPNRPFSMAYHLAVAVWKDRLPEDLQNFEDYGFDRAVY